MLLREQVAKGGEWACRGTVKIMGWGHVVDRVRDLELHCFRVLGPSPHVYLMTLGLGMGG